MQTITDSVPLTQAAKTLRMSWPRAWRLVLEGHLQAEQAANGRWYVDSADLARLEREFNQESGRRELRRAG